MFALLRLQDVLLHALTFTLQTIFLGTGVDSLSVKHTVFDLCHYVLHFVTAISACLGTLVKKFPSWRKESAHILALVWQHGFSLQLWCK